MAIKFKAACAAASLALATGAAASPTCWTPQEIEAARVRDLQTIMMVGALRCSAAGYNTAFGYDRFVVRHRSALVQHNETLKNYFIRTAGRGGQRGYDSFTTALANAHSSESSDMRSYCDRVDSLVRASLTVQPGDLVFFAEEVSERPFGVGETCAAGEARQGPVVTAAVAQPAVEAAPAPQPVVAEAAPAPAAELPAVRPAVAEAAAMPAAEPQPAVAEVVRPDPNEALRQATAALHAATVALQAAMEAQAAPAPRPVSAPVPAAPAQAGPKRAPVTPTVLEPSPVVLPADATQFVG